MFDYVLLQLTVKRPEKHLIRTENAFEFKANNRLNHYNNI